MSREEEAYVTGSSRGRRLSMVLVLLAVVVAMVAVAMGGALGGGGRAVAAPAAPDATIEATSFSVAANQIGEEYAVCPGNKRALGGGVVQSGPAAGVDVLASGPLASSGVTAKTVSGSIPKQWYAAVTNGSEGTRDFKVFAICSARSKATIEATSFSVADKKIGEEFAVCPGNKRALGGGVVQSGPASNVYMVASGPLNSSGVTAKTVSGSIPKQWYAAVTNGSGKARDFKVFAICSARSKATIEATSFSVAGGQTGEEFAVCPGNKRALGGGVVQSGSSDSLRVRASGPLDSSGVTAQTVSGDIAKQWYAAVLNGSGRARDFKVFAICSARSKATIEATSFSLAAGRASEEFAVCPGNKRALGGGVVQSGSSDALYVRASGPLNSSGVTAQTQSGDIAKQWYAAVASNSTKARDFKVFAVCE